MQHNNLNKNKEKEWVNHPEHYKNNKYECIDVMLDTFGEEAVLNFCLLNAFKYIYRCKSKHETPTEDVEKAVWYLNEMIKFLEESNQNEK